MPRAQDAQEWPLFVISFLPRFLPGTALPRTRSARDPLLSDPRKCSPGAWRLAMSDSERTPRFFFSWNRILISTANITMQFGAKPLFENISVKFGNGNRYGLIGANGCGKSTFMKILGGDLAQTAGTVSIDSDERLGKLRQDQFAFEDYTVLEPVIMGHAELRPVKTEP